MKRRITILALFCLFSGTAACSLILGNDDGPQHDQASPQLRFTYVETLRDQDSLQGESMREVKTYADAAKAASALQHPVSVAADAFRVYVTDELPQGRLAIFDRGLHTLVSLTAPVVPPTIAQTPYVAPVAVAVDASEYVYVADPGQARVFTLDRDGGLLFTIGVTGDLSYPSALAADPKRGRLYVADRNANVVRVFTPRGDALHKLGGRGRKEDFRSPVGVALGRDGRCFVLDGLRQRVYVYDVNGALMTDFAVSQERPLPARKLAGIAIDEAGRVYVTDQLNHVILIFDEHGTFLQQWGGLGSRRDEFWSPSGISIDEQGTIYIADQMNGRIQVYRRAQ